MVKNYYLAGGFTIDDTISPTKWFFKRPDLVDVPSLLEYTCEEEMLDNEKIYFYINSMSICIFLVEYGNFTTDAEMWNDYKIEKQLYNDLYKKIIGKISNRFSNKIDDVDWIMPILIGEDIVNPDSISLSDINFIIKKSDEYNSKCVQALDAMFIYQSTARIGSFFKSITIKQQLTKFEQYQLSFYIQELKILEKPSYYLTNQQEIEIMKEYYSKWDLETQIKTALEISANTIELFEFLSHNTKDTRNQISTLLMSFLTLILMYDPIGELITFLFPEFQGDAISIILRFFILICSLIVLYKIVQILICNFKENLELRRKSKK